MLEHHSHIPIDAKRQALDPPGQAAGRGRTQLWGIPPLLALLAGLASQSAVERLCAVRYTADPTCGTP